MDVRQLDALARQQGFKNYEQFAAWDRNTRQVVMQQPNVAGGQPGAQAPRNWLQQLMSSVHPLNYVNQKLEGVLGGR